MIRLAYFDRVMWLPLWGEGDALRRLGGLDFPLAIHEANLAVEQTGHFIESVSALLHFAELDPLAVFAVRCSNSLIYHTPTRLDRLITSRLSEGSKRAWNSMDRLFDLCHRLVATDSYESNRRLDDVVAQHLASNKMLEQHIVPPTRAQIVDTIQQAIDDLELAQRQKPHLQNLEAARTLYRTILQGICVETIQDLAACSSPGSLSMESEDATSAWNSLILVCQRYLQVTSRVTQANLVLDANEKLNRLSWQLRRVPWPAGPLLAVAVGRWRQVLAQTGGAFARGAVAGPVANPYVAGNPVQGHLFVGREDVLRRLEELWLGEGLKPSVVIYGHRRMGKTSILRNLGTRFEPNWMLVDFNMQRVGIVNSTAELLHSLAFELHDALLKSEPKIKLSLPDTFSAGNPRLLFDRYLRQLDQVRNQRRFLVMVDEFEIIERQIQERKLEPTLLEFFRSLIQTYPWFVMAFAGLHTLQEMTADYWHPLFGSVTGVPVGFLDNKAARRLITNPSADFPLDYDEEALVRVFALTNGQPYLTQLVGHALVTRHNRQTFEEGMERQRRFSLSDVEAVIAAPEFFRDGDAYFTGVWSQAEQGQPPIQTRVLQAIAQLTDETERMTDSSQIAQRSGLDQNQVDAAIEALVRHEIVRVHNGRCQLTVELLRRWILQHRDDS